MDRVQRRRDAILDAASRLFAGGGVHRTTIADVARECEVSVGTIYNYFDDKQAVLVALLDRLARAEQAKLQLGARSRADFADVVEAYILQRLNLLWSQRELLRAVLPEVLCDPVLRRAYYDEVLEPAQRRGERAVAAAHRGGETDVDPESFSRLVGGAALGIVLMALLGDGALAADPEQCARETTELLLRSAAVPGAGQPASHAD